MLQKTNFSRVNFSLWVLLRHFTVLTLFQIGLMMTQSKMGLRLHLFWDPRAPESRLLLVRPWAHDTSAARCHYVTAARADKLTMAGYLKERLNNEKVTCTNFRLMKWLLINCSEQSPADTNIQSVWCFPTKWWNLRPGAVTSLFLLNGGTNIQFYILTFSFDIRNPYCWCHYHTGISMFSKLSDVKQAWKPKPHIYPVLYDFGVRENNKARS